MVIGIDIDDTMTDTSELIMVNAKKYFNRDDEEFIYEILHLKNLDDNLLNFYKKYLPNMLENYKLKDNVKEVIDRLREKGNKVIVITARGNSFDMGQVESTNEYFKKHNIIVDDIIMKEKDKKPVCKKMNVDIMIDDSISVLESLKDSSTKPLLFSSIGNQNQDVDFDRVDNWLDLERYITNLKS